MEKQQTAAETRENNSLITGKVNTDRELPSL
jgi:hypothetical protein